MIRLVAAGALSLVLSANADDNEWVYDTSGRTEIAPTTADAVMQGLDARTRGFAEAAPSTVDKWYWSRDISNTWLIHRNRPGFCLIFK